MYNSLGDATIDMYTGAPFDATASYPAAVPVGIGQLDFSVSAGAEALEGALVCVRGGVVQQTGYTDASGQVQLVLNPAPDTVGELQVTITAHNMRRYEGIIQVISPEGPYLVHSDHEVTSDGTTPVAPTPGLHIVMPVTLHNIGSDPATGIDATISTASSDVTISQNQLSYNDIATDALGRSTTHAEFDIHPDAADGSVASFALDWSADGDYAATTNFSVTIQRPRLVYVSHAVDDSAGGCDQDGIADANEPTVFEVTVENQGSADANQVAVDLAAPDCNDNGPVQIGSVLSGQQGLAVITVTPQQSAPCPAEDVLFEVQATATELPTADVSSF